jgi:hypothetical protein
MKPVTMLCVATLVSSCASAPQPVHPDERDTFVTTVFEPSAGNWISLSDHPELRVGIRNDASTLFVRALVWNDGDDKLGVDAVNGSPIGDYPVLMLHFGNEPRRTAGRDVNVHLNQWPHLPGIRVTRYTSANMTTPLEPVKGASGSIQYLPGPAGRPVRSEVYAVPLSALGLEPGAEASIAFYVYSSSPTLVASTIPGFERGNYFPPAIPVARYQPIRLQGR